MLNTPGSNRTIKDKRNFFVIKEQSAEEDTDDANHIRIGKISNSDRGHEIKGNAKKKTENESDWIKLPLLCRTPDNGPSGDDF